MRWYPRAEDVTRVAQIEHADLIGYRESLRAFIDTKTRSHVPVRGGYSEIAPNFMVGGDCIVFSGGRLSESLREVSPWLPTPNVPGRGQGRLLVCFSPFMAGHQALAVLGNDSEGLGNAAEKIVAAVAEKRAPRDTTKGVAGWSHEVVVKQEILPVPQPYRDFTPFTLTATAAPGPVNYREPETLALARSHLGAKRVASWKPAGDARSAFGRQFFPLTGQLELAATATARETFVHLVYPARPRISDSPCKHRARMAPRNFSSTNRRPSIASWTCPCAARTRASR